MTLRRATGVWFEHDLDWWPSDDDDKPTIETVFSGKDLMTWLLPSEAVIISWTDPEGEIEMSATIFSQLHRQQSAEPVIVGENSSSAMGLWWWQDRFYWGQAGLTAEDVSAMAEELNDRTREQTERALPKSARAARLAFTKRSLHLVVRHELWTERTVVRAPHHRWFFMFQEKFVVSVWTSAEFRSHARAVPPVISVTVDRETYEQARNLVTYPDTETPLCIENRSCTIWIAKGNLYTTTDEISPEDVRTVTGDYEPAKGTAQEAEEIADAHDNDDDGDAVLRLAGNVRISLGSQEATGVHWSCNRDPESDELSCDGAEAWIKTTVFRELERLHTTTPVAIARDKRRHRTLWWYRDGHWWDDEELTAEEVELTLFDRERRRDAKFDRLRKIRAREADLAEARRERIPEEVRAFVWERDEGRCVTCGAKDDLQFDHVIPVARGGGASVDNIQILCGDCNRQKSDSIV